MDWGLLAILSMMASLVALVAWGGGLVLGLW